MTCQNSQISDLILAWNDGALSPDESHRVAEHVRHCADCRREADTLREISARLSGAFRVQRSTRLEALCPGPEVLVDFVEGGLHGDLADQISFHLELCAGCCSEKELILACNPDPAAAAHEMVPPMDARLRG